MKEKLEREKFEKEQKDKEEKERKLKEKLDKEQKDISSLIRSLWEPELGVDKVYPLISRISAASVKIITDDVKALPLKYC